jgi:hypothetical protein
VTWQAGFHRRGFRWMKPWVHAETGNLFSSRNNNKGPVHLAYNLSYSACFFSQNSIFLSQKISQQCFSAGL